MGWIRDALGWFRNSRPNEITTSKELDDWMRFGGAGSIAGIPVTVENAQGLAAVAACDRVLSNAIAHLPLRVMRRTGTRREPARDLPVYGVLHDRVNDWQVSFQWRKLAMRDLLYRGNTYAIKIMGDRSVVGLRRVHPDLMQTRSTPDGRSVEYVYTQTNGSSTPLPRERVLHIWSDSDDGIKGLSPIRRYRESIGDGLALRQHGSRFFSNAARPGIILEQAVGTKMSPEATKALLADFDAMYAGNENAHRTALSPPGIVIKPLSLTMEDAQWIESRKTTAREIFGIFGIPPHKAGDLADATFSNIEHENLAFVIDSVTPWAVCFEQCINRDLLNSDPTLFAKFNLDALLRGDAKSRAEALNIKRRAGVISANEWRELDDMNPRTDPGGDEFIVEQNMRPQDGTTIEATPGAAAA